MILRRKIANRSAVHIGITAAQTVGAAAEPRERLLRSYKRPEDWGLVRVPDAPRPNRQAPFQALCR
jgi:hypothetical protein